MKNTHLTRKYFLSLVILLTIGCAFLPSVSFTGQPANVEDSSSVEQDLPVDQAATPTRMTPIIVTPTKPIPPTPEPGADEIIATDPGSFILASGGLQFITFFTTWCDVCHGMAPTINSLADEYEDRIVFVALDLDDPGNNSIAAMLSHGVIPEYYLVDGDGNVLDTWIGDTPSGDFRDSFESALGN